MEEGRVRRNDNLGAIFKRLDIQGQQLQSILDDPQDVFDFKKIKRGNKYLVFREKDSTRTVRFFVYIEDPVHYYVFELGDNPQILPGENSPVSKFHMVSGTIEYSLWQTIIDQELNPYLAIELSEIFAWSIDFFGLQKGDAFKVIYEEQYVDSLSIGISRILAAWFFHSGEEFYAIPLEQNGREDYFDQEGNNLRKAFLKAPLRFSRISSGFSHSRMHPILKIRRPHHGVDYAAPLGTPVQAIGDGVVIEAAYKSQSGRIVKIKHNSVYTTAYLHLSRFGPGIRVGKYVKQGDIIGYVGSTGLSTGPHLDFRFYRNDRAVNPLSVEAPPVEPLLDERKPAFEKVKFVMMSLLETIE
jgi:murein DD-endopeptidase MepM/ murein hydrolase activator NlpD